MVFRQRPLETDEARVAFHFFTLPPSPDAISRTRRRDVFFFFVGFLLTELLHRISIRVPARACAHDINH